MRLCIWAQLAIVLAAAGCGCGGDDVTTASNPRASAQRSSIFGYWEEIENGKPITIAVYNQDGTFRIEALDPTNRSRKLRASGEYRLAGNAMVRTFKSFDVQGVNGKQRANMLANASRQKSLPLKATVEWVDPQEFHFTEEDGRTSIWRRKPGT